MSEYKGKNQKDLIKELTEKKSKLNEFRFAVAGSKAKNVREGRVLRRDIARIMTEISTPSASKK
ncbi:MAG: 50S ribosomal protein L29 [Candidatus Pacebacteria bacterium]|nr:50S ribosomal protein L29 [Candidatus Paceibacterota bacterium]